MKKIKLLTTLTSLAAIGATTPIVATSCSSTPEANLTSLYWYNGEKLASDAIQVVAGRTYYMDAKYSATDNKNLTEDLRYGIYKLADDGTDKNLNLEFLESERTESGYVAKIRPVGTLSTGDYNLQFKLTCDNGLGKEGNTYIVKGKVKVWSKADAVNIDVTVKLEGITETVVEGKAVSQAFKRNDLITYTISNIPKEVDLSKVTAIVTYNTMVYPAGFYTPLEIEKSGSTMTIKVVMSSYSDYGYILPYSTITLSLYDTSVSTVDPTYLGGYDFHSYGTTYTLNSPTVTHCDWEVATEKTDAILKNVDTSTANATAEFAVPTGAGVEGEFFFLHTSPEGEMWYLPENDTSAKIYYISETESPRTGTIYFNNANKPIAEDVAGFFTVVYYDNAGIAITPFTVTLKSA